MDKKSLVKAISARINLSLDIPLISESQESVYINLVVAWLVQFLPDSVLNFIFDASDGISPEEIGRLEDVLVMVLNSKVDLPVIPESVEATLIRPVVSAVLELAKEGLSIHTPATA